MSGTELEASARNLHPFAGDQAAEQRAPSSEVEAMTEQNAFRTRLRSLPPDAGNGSDAGAQSAGESSSPREAPPGQLAGLAARVTKIEKQNRRLKYAIAALVVLAGYMVFDQFVPDSVIVKQTLLESEEVKLIDKMGNTRFFLRMYSRVPVLQLLDTNGKPRMSLGLRFDDTPFIDLSDKTGQTRATFEMTEKDEPTLSLFDENGDTTFTIK